MNNTLANGLSLLMRLAESPRPHSIKELAEATELPPSNVHRLLQTLIECEYVEKRQGRRYSIGLGALRLGHALLLNLPVRQRAVPAMVELAREVGLSVSLVMPFADRAIVIANVSHDGRIRPFDQTLGAVLSATESASGKAFLACLEPGLREARLEKLAQELPPSRLAQLRVELAEIERTDFALKSHSPNGSDPMSVAVPIRDAAGDAIACLGLSGPHDRFPPHELDDLLRPLRRTVDQITHTPLETPA
ncbi:MAG: IclR family transcriptional regulator [Planctomycetota bacterium]